MKATRELKFATHIFLPSAASTRTIADVFLLMFFLPSGLNVERQVRHGVSSGGAVKHEMLGTLPEVPVPTKMRSNGAVDFCWYAAGMSRKVGESVSKI